MNTELLYQKIGEFVVSFQWLEHRIRQIGWIINDPERKIWPPKEFRDDSNSELLKKVEALYINFLNTNPISDRENKVLAFQKIIESFHHYRRYRNTLLHSAFIEIHGGGELKEIWRSNPKLKYEEGNPIFDTETMTPGKIDVIMRKMAHDALELNKFYIQAIHLAKGI